MVVQFIKCPKCERSLWFVKDVCPYCKATLPQDNSEVSLTPDDDESSAAVSLDWVTLASFATMVEADAIRAQLEAAGIAVLLPDENLMQNMPVHVHAYGYIRLQVSSHDLETAKGLLAVIKKEVMDASSEPIEDPASLALSKTMRWFAFIMPVLTCVSLIIFIWVKDAYSERGCKRKEKEFTTWFVCGAAFWMIGFAGLVLFLELTD